MRDDYGLDDYLKEQARARKSKIVNPTQAELNFNWTAKYNVPVKGTNGKGSGNGGGGSYPWHAKP